MKQEKKTFTLRFILLLQMSSPVLFTICTLPHGPFPPHIVSEMADAKAH